MNAIEQDYEVPLKLKEVASRMRCSENTVRRLRKEANFPDPVYGGYLWSEIVKWQSRKKEIRNQANEVEKQKIEALIEEHLAEAVRLKQKLRALNNRNFVN